ncbi:lysophospholipase [Oscillatoria sp. FACHB-1406]|nr:lysophospholipase [Oscillatoria sp. FACHB-1406]
MQRFEGTFRGAGGLALFYQTWHPPRQARAIALLVHGLGAHSGVFDNLVSPLVARDFAVYEFDLRGHGKSAGQRGYIENWSEFREDLAIFSRLARDEQPHCPLFLIGHSLGGLIVLDWALHFPALARGIVVLSPPLGEVGVSPFRIRLAHLLSRILPRFSLSTEFDWSSLSRDAEAIATAQQDSLRHDRATARLATELFKTLAEIRDRAAQFEVALLIQHGSCDRVAFPEGSRQFFASLTHPDKELHEYPGAFHEMHNDLNAAETIADAIDWLERHLPPSNT